MKSTSLIAILLVAALAGCAADETPSATIDDTNADPTSNDEASPPESPVEIEPETPPCLTPPSTSDEPGERGGYPEIVFTVQEPSEDDPCFYFKGPETVSAGWTAITLNNDGMAPHIMPMFRLDGGMTYSDFLIAGASGEIPEFAMPVGGVGVATPFSSGTVLIDLEPGVYVFVCFIEGHHMHGMHRELVVTASENEPLAAPEAAYTITAHDFGFDVPEMTAGTHVIAFVNEGTEVHEAPLIALAQNATMEEFLAALENPTGPPPGAGVGGVNVLAPGATAYMLVTLEAGEYGLVCFVPSPEHDHAPHIALGMVTQFSVTESVADEADGDNTDDTETEGGDDDNGDEA